MPQKNKDKKLNLQVGDIFFLEMRMIINYMWKEKGEGGGGQWQTTALRADEHLFPWAYTAI